MRKPRTRKHNEPTTRITVYLPVSLAEFAATYGKTSKAKDNASAGVQRALVEARERREAAAVLAYRRMLAKATDGDDDYGLEPVA